MAFWGVVDEAEMGSLEMSLDESPFFRCFVCECVQVGGV